MPGLAEDAREDPLRRWRNGMAFRQPDGRLTYIVRPDLHYLAGGSWREHDLRLRSDTLGGYDELLETGRYRLRI